MAQKEATKPIEERANIELTGTLYTSAQGAAKNKLAFAEQIYDELLGQFQSEINQYLEHLIEPVVYLTYAELKALKEAGSLVVGKEYIMTDYEFTTTQEETLSANHPFNLIFTAISNHSFEPIVRAEAREGDTYYQYCNMEAWEIHYDFDNDTHKYGWADPVNGKGVIYYLKDDRNVECGYDFKNAQFKRYWVDFDPNVYVHKNDGTSYLFDEYFNDLGWSHRSNRHHRYFGTKATKFRSTTINEELFAWCYTFSLYSVLNLDTATKEVTFGLPFLDGTVQSTLAEDSPLYGSETAWEDPHWGIKGENIITARTEEVTVEGKKMNLLLLPDVVIFGTDLIDDNQSRILDLHITNSKQITIKGYLIEGIDMKDVTNAFLGATNGEGKFLHMGNITFNWGTNFMLPFLGYNNYFSHGGGIEEEDPNYPYKKGVGGTVFGNYVCDSTFNDIASVLMMGHFNNVKATGTVQWVKSYYNFDNCEIESWSDLYFYDCWSVTGQPSYTSAQSFKDCKLYLNRARAESTDVIHNMYLKLGVGNSDKVNGHIFNIPENTDTDNLFTWYYFTNDDKLVTTNINLPEIIRLIQAILPASISNVDELKNLLK